MQAQNTFEADAANLEATRTALGERAAVADAALHESMPASREGRIDVEFLSNLAHQLRSPLSSLRVWVDLLSDPGVLQNPSSIERLVEGIDRATTRLERQITDVLEAGYLEAGTLTVETSPVDATEQLVLAVADLEQATKSRQVGIDLNFGDRSSIVIADATRLRQLIGRILSNAIRFSPVGSVVRVTTSHIPGIAGGPETTTAVEPQFDGPALYICVADSGPGIDPDLHFEVFKPFHRVSRKDTHGGGGSGLGLAITIGMLRLLRGGVWLRSGLNSGVEFEFSLPLAASAPGSQDVSRRAGRMENAQ